MEHLYEVLMPSCCSSPSHLRSQHHRPKPRGRHSDPSKINCWLRDDPGHSCDGRWQRPVSSHNGLHQTFSINFSVRLSVKSDKGITAMMNFYILFKMPVTGFPCAPCNASCRQLSVDKSITESWKELTLQTWHPCTNREREERPKWEPEIIRKT